MPQKTIRLVSMLALLAAPPALAMEDVDQIIQIEVIEGGATRDGTVLGGLRLTLAPGWKTYWRAPGDAGIPPLFSFTGSENVAHVGITWPAPEVFDQNGMTSIGYAQEVVLPLHITPQDADAPLHLSGNVELGICKDVCIPGHLSFNGALTPDAARSPAIVAAIAARPYSPREAGVQHSRCALSQSARGGIELTATIDMPSAGGAETVVFEPGDPMIWASQAEVTRQGGQLVARAELLHPDGAFAFDRSALRITVLGDSHAVDIKGCEAG